MRSSQLEAEAHTRPALVPAPLRYSFAAVTVLFFLWGIPNNLNDVLIRQFMESFQLSRFQAGLVQSAFYLGYFLLALPAGLLMRNYGYKAGLVTGLLLFAVGCGLFWPAAVVNSYAFFLSSLFVVASGLSFLETAANPFIAQLGPEPTAERRLNLAQAFNPLGSITGVLLGVRFIFSGVELSPAQQHAMQQAGTYAAYRYHETLRVVAPYAVLAVVAAGWALLIARMRLPETARAAATTETESISWARLRTPGLALAVVAQFLYIGAQVGTWSYFISYARDYTAVGNREAGLLLTLTLVAFAVGRFFSSWFMRFVPPAPLMMVYSLLNVALVSVGILFPGWVGLATLTLTSFFMSVMYPTIFALGIRGLGAEARLAGSFLVMSIIGGGVLTPLMGLLAEFAHSTALAYTVPLACYVYIAFFSYYEARHKNVREEALL